MGLFRAVVGSLICLRDYDYMSTHTYKVIYPCWICSCLRLITMSRDEAFRIPPNQRIQDSKKASRNHPHPLQSHIAAKSQFTTETTLWSHHTFTHNLWTDSLSLRSQTLSVPPFTLSMGLLRSDWLFMSHILS